MNNLCDKNVYTQWEKLSIHLSIQYIYTIQFMTYESYGISFMILIQKLTALNL